MNSVFPQIVKQFNSRLRSPISLVIRYRCHRNSTSLSDLRATARYTAYIISGEIVALVNLEVQTVSVHRVSRGNKYILTKT